MSNPSVWRQTCWNFRKYILVVINNFLQLMLRYERWWTKHTLRTACEGDWSTSPLSLSLLVWRNIVDEFWDTHNSAVRAPFLIHMYKHPIRQDGSGSLSMRGNNKDLLHPSVMSHTLLRMHKHVFNILKENFMMSNSTRHPRLGGASQTKRSDGVKIHNETLLILKAFRATPTLRLLTISLLPHRPSPKLSTPTRL